MELRHSNTILRSLMALGGSSKFYGNCDNPSPSCSFSCLPYHPTRWYQKPPKLHPKRQDAEVEQYAEKLRRKGQQLQKLGTCTKLNVSYFPAELIQGEKGDTLKAKDHVGIPNKMDLACSKNLKRKLRKAKAGLLPSLNNFLRFQLPEKYQDGDGKDNNKKEKKEGDEEMEEDLEKEEVISSEDDYAQNEYFDDEEDDINIEEEPEED